MSQIDTVSRAVPQLAIFTDFDGTLVELAETPDAIEVADTLLEELRHAMRELDSAFAVLTGREIADIDKYLAPLHLPVAGAHGTQRRRADGVLEAIDPATIRGAEAIAQSVQPLILANPDLLLEKKEGAVALHYRQAPELEAAVRSAMEEAVRDTAGFGLVPGKMVLEARPLGVSKGEALRAFMREEPFIGRTPIFIGDDVTDEDGFIAAQDLGGVGIKLGDGETAARMRIPNVASVHALIRGLGDIAARDRETALTH
ncbi:MAG: trehalose-phosphatase [Alphaproteobacteria bacterium]|jgi:trehalose 6-phosphate phosphatase|nr:trehalose-phosphatase [Alphaproteobacteria bacterium]MBU1560559.1 trehalose-phosphatase [Alphaproteobacteria bacterium]MBU2301385.1 trehalose-phosphatase [Alphaproteobacteria bacterium]MBU2367338.1 trehalose-phosphatase [Alphaproteobacteria bacterium]